MAGLAFVVPASALCAVGFGGAEASLQLIGPLSTYTLPVIVMIALWWDGWPGTRLRGPFVGIANLVVVVVAGLALTVLAQLVVAEVDLRSLVDASPGAGHLPLYPTLMPLAATAFVTLLQLTLVCEKWPCDRLGPIAGGVAALALSWAAAVAAWLVLANLDAAPAADFAGTGLRNPGGPIADGALAQWLVALTGWQVLLVVGLGGWPFTAIGRRGLRLLVANVVTLGLGSATFVVLRHGLDWTGPELTLLGGCVVGASLLVAILFDSWPGPGPVSARGVVVNAAVIVTVALALGLGGLALGNALADWSDPTVEEWVTFTTLNYLPGTAVVHVALWRRWPLPPAPAPVAAPAPA